MIACRICLVVVPLWNALLGAGHLLRGGTEQSFFCLQGKGAPQVYLLGAQKSGTTSMYSDFLRVGLATASDKKEMHAFNGVCNFNKAKSMSQIMGVENSGACPEAANAEVRDALARRLIRQCGWRGLFDATPDSLRLPGLPKMLHSLYGTSSTSLLFVVLLRDPLRRSHSGFYQQQHGKMKRLVNTFQGYVSGIRKSGRLDQYRKADWKGIENDYSIDIIYRSLYSLQFRHWLEPALFQAKQFTVAPMGKYFGNVELTRGLLGHIGKSLHMDLRLDLVHRPTEEHVSSYTPLKYDLDVESRKWLNQFFVEDTQRLCELFARYHKDGLDLYDYKGTSNAEDIHSYVTGSW